MAFVRKQETLKWLYKLDSTMLLMRSCISDIYEKRCSNYVSRLLSGANFEIVIQGRFYNAINEVLHIRCPCKAMQHLWW